MSLNLYNRIRKNFNIRLTLWYLAVLIIAYALLFTIAYYSLFSSLKREDEKIILLKFKEYSAEYEKDEITGVEKRINAERDGEKPMPFFVRIADKDNRTLSLSLPDKWTGIDLDVIGRISVQNKEQKTHVFEILSFPLGDGNFMQIGKEVGHREEILAQFRRVFTGVVFPAILISIMGGYLVTFRAIRPIRNLTQTVQSIIDNNRMDVRVSGGKTEDEINGLVILFNTMLDRIENLIKGMKESLDNVAHDLRTPMTRLKMIAESAIQEDKGTEDCREALSDCLEESERILKILNTLMDISEAKAKTLKLDIRQIDISSLVEEVVELYHFIAEEKDIIIEVKCQQGLHVSADPDRMRQVLANLIDNAVKYTPNGGRVYVDTFKKDRQVTIAIKDTGIGIREEDLPKIFDRLYRADVSRTQRGLGLGLAIVKSLLELHAAHIEVASKLGTGSTFTVYLPQDT